MQKHIWSSRINSDPLAPDCDRKVEMSFRLPSSLMLQTHFVRISSDCYSLLLDFEMFSSHSKSGSYPDIRISNPLFRCR